MRTITPSESYRYMCSGPGIDPHTEKCLYGVNWHTDNSTDTLPYNGVRNWRCKKCFDEHRRRVREKNS